MMEFSLSKADPALESECPVCLETFKSPVLQCYNGHLICHICEPRCPQCPVCREVMPERKVRNIAFEKMLSSLDQAQVPCPHRGSGCLLMMRRQDVDSHKLDCVFTKKKFCSQLGFSCEEECCIVTIDDMIQHFMRKHGLTGCVEEESNDAKNESCKLELVEIYTKSTFKKNIPNSQWKNPNFIKFDGNLFLLKKNVDLKGKVVSFVVCMDASLDTAGMYTAIIEVSSPGTIDSSENHPFKIEFLQPAIHLLPATTHFNFTSDEAREWKYFQISFADFQHNSNRTQERNWKIEVTIKKKSASTSPPSSPRSAPAVSLEAPGSSARSANASVRPVANEVVHDNADDDGSDVDEEVAHDSDHSYHNSDHDMSGSDEDHDDEDFSAHNANANENVEADAYYDCEDDEQTDDDMSCTDNDDDDDYDDGNEDNGSHHDANTNYDHDLGTLEDANYSDDDADDDVEADVNYKDEDDEETEDDMSCGDSDEGDDYEDINGGYEETDNNNSTVGNGSDRTDVGTYDNDDNGDDDEDNDDDGDNENEIDCDDGDNENEIDCDDGDNENGDDYDDDDDENGDANNDDDDSNANDDDNDLSDGSEYDDFESQDIEININASADVDNGNAIDQDYSNYINDDEGDDYASDADYDEDCEENGIADPADYLDDDNASASDDYDNDHDMDDSDYSDGDY